MYCYKYSYNDGMQLVHCIDESLAATSMKTKDLFGSGIPSQPTAAMSASWPNTLVKSVYFIKNDNLFKGLFSANKTLSAVQGKTELNASYWGVTAVLTGINPSEYVLFRESYIFDNKAGQKGRVCLSE